MRAEGAVGRRGEPEAMVEAVLACLTGDPRVLTGRDVASIELLRELGRPVHDGPGRVPMPGWQPDDLPAYIAARPHPIAVAVPRSATTSEQGDDA